MRKFGKGRSPSKFSFTYEDVASAVGCSTAAVRKHAQRGNFDPHDLISVLEFIQVKLQKKSGLAEVIERTRQAASEG